jgi:ABC-type branched-subunit amino acid transport system ATPase component
VTDLRVENLSGGYGPLIVFRGANFSVAANHVIGVLGPNGAGKTTLLKTVSGLLPAQNGRIYLGEEDVTLVRANYRARLGLALVPEGRQIFRGLSVRENLRLSFSAGRLTANEFQRRYDEVMSLFPKLAERQSESGGSLSGGEQQMLAIGRALLLDPTVLLLDEPTQGLAPIMIQQVLTALKQLKGRFPIVLIEQNLAFLKELADETLTMRAGSLFQTNDYQLREGLTHE